tara:strand:- start:490 stop:693 length:204 start_codon:yes stop_codon:yes gene_type:complete
MAKKDFGNVVGKCSICTINLWDSTDGKPAIWPCNVKGCPYESKAKQNQLDKIPFQSPTGSGIGQIDF